MKTMEDGTELQDIIAQLSTLEKEMVELEIKLAGSQVAGSELHSQLMKITSSTTASEEAKAEAQRKFKNEKIRYKELLDEQQFLEIKIHDLRVKKRTKIATIKAEEDAERLYDEPAPLRPAPPIPVQPPIQGSVISQIPTYGGEKGDACETFVRLIDRTKSQQNWKSKATAEIVRTKLKDEAQLFIDNQEKELVQGIENWDEPQANGENLRQMLLNRFTIPTSELAATEALEGLKQGNKETVDMFYERTRYAVDKLLSKSPKTTDAERESFQHMFRTQIFIFFKAGMKASYRTKIFSAPQGQIPLTSQELLQAARNAERESNNQIRQINEMSTQDEDDPMAAINKRIDELTESLKSKQLEYINGRGGGRGRWPRRGTRGRGGRGRGAPQNQGQGQGQNNDNQGNKNQGQGRGRGNGRKSIRNKFAGNYTNKPWGQCFRCGDPNHWADKCPWTTGVESLMGDDEEENWDDASESQGPDPNQGNEDGTA